MEKNLWNENF